MSDLSSWPTPAAQTALLDRLRADLEPLLLAERVPTAFHLQPGVRLRRAYGRCAWTVGSEPPCVSIRCTADGDRTRWRRHGAIVGTLLHEVAHLRYRSHGPRFWTLHRRLVDRAVAAGLYDPTDRDPEERGRGDEKLAASAARPVALAARQARRERARASRAALQTWQVGAVARIGPGGTRLAGTPVRVLALGRTRLVVEAAEPAPVSGQSRPPGAVGAIESAAEPTPGPLGEPPQRTGGTFGSERRQPGQLRGGHGRR